MIFSMLSRAVLCVEQSSKTIIHPEQSPEYSLRSVFSQFLYGIKQLFSIKKRNMKGVEKGSCFGRGISHKT